MVKEIDSIIGIDLASQAAFGLKRVLPQACAHKQVKVGTKVDIIPDGQPVPAGGVVIKEYLQGQPVTKNPVRHTIPPTLYAEPGMYNHIHDHGSSHKPGDIPVRYEKAD